MEDILELTKSDILVTERNRISQNVTEPTSRRTITNPTPGNLVIEGGESFFNYLNLVEPDKDSSILVLSSRHHYFYDVDELKGVKILVNLKRLNFINQLESFIHIVGNILSSNTKFVGCFADHKTQKGIGTLSRMYTRFITFLDDRIDIEIDKRYLIQLFESSGFKIIDMSEINGLTYFTTIKCENKVFQNILSD